MELDFEIDKITNSIENVKTGEVLKTLVLPLEKADLKEITKKNGWLFDWKYEFSLPEHQVFKLVSVNDPKVIHGLVAFVKQRDHVYMSLIESSPFNFGKDKKYLGVATNLVAFVCKTSMEYGFDGVLAFEPKTALIEHYEKTLGAVRISERKMAIFEDRARFFINKYFPEYEMEEEE